jgi:hypothetical protein
VAEAVVFLGPSLDWETARRILPGIRLAPPARRGDIDRLLDAPPRLLGIVDGQFLQSLAVSPKEVLRALRCGVRVFGASSVGALRAVELEPFGMVGVGRIYELYRSGALQADDEVALVYDPETLRPLSEPLVNIRIALEAAAAEGVIPPAAAEEGIARAKALYFPQRTYRAVLRLLEPCLSPAEHAGLAAFLRERAPDAKRADAIALLERLRSEVQAAGP